ncbi:hypothetical protein CR513_37085, partial [Mucuna pruriens]
MSSSPSRLRFHMSSPFPVVKCRLRMLTLYPRADSDSDSYKLTPDVIIIMSIWIPLGIETNSALAILSISSSSNLHKLDPEIDRTLYRLRKVRSIDTGSSSFISIPDSVNNNCTTICSNFSKSNSFESKPNIRVDISHEPKQMETKNRTLKELAMPNVLYQPWCIQYPHKHLKEFHMVCSTMKPLGILDDYIKMKVFPFSLDGATKDCLCGIRQHLGVTLHKYWEIFNKLCATCLYHQISEQLLLQYFYEGLMMMD